MSQHPFGWLFIALLILGTSHTILEKLFWARLGSVDPGAGQRLLGVDLRHRRAAGVRRLWRFLFKREYAQIQDRVVVRLGDSTLVSLVAFCLVFLLLFGMVIARSAALFRT